MMVPHGLVETDTVVVIFCVQRAGQSGAGSGTIVPFVVLYMIVTVHTPEQECRLRFSITVQRQYVVSAAGDRVFSCPAQASRDFPVHGHLCLSVQSMHPVFISENMGPGKTPFCDRGKQIPQQVFQFRCIGLVFGDVAGKQNKIRFGFLQDSLQSYGTDTDIFSVCQNGVKKQALHPAARYRYSFCELLFHTVPSCTCRSFSSGIQSLT